MSHVVKVSLKITDVESAERACEALGGEFHRDVTRFKSYVGDNDCTHKITVPGAAFEVGVVANPLEAGVFGLEFDGWGRQGRPIEEAFGKGLCKLKDEYGAQVAEQHMQAEGWQTHRAQSEEGHLQVKAWKA